MVIFESGKIGTFVRTESAVIERALKTRFRADSGRFGGKIFLRILSL
jgi:hypothetical protein